MRKSLKIGAIVVGIVVGLIALAIILAMIFIDPNRYRDDIVKVVKEQTGRDLKIDGRLRLSLYPWIGLETGRLELANAKGFGPEPFARVDTALVRVELLPLLHKQVAVDAVQLKGLQLHLARAANGRNNWDDLGRSKPAAKPAAKPAKPSAPEQPPGGAALAAFSVNHLEVRDGEFTWRDAAARTQYAVRGLDLTAGNLLGAQPAPFKLAFNLESKNPPIRERVQLDSQLRFDLAKEALDVPALTLTLGDLRLQAQLHASDVLNVPKLAGTIEIPAFDARALLQRLGIDYKPADANALRKVALRTQLRHDAKESALSDLRLTLDDTQLTGNLAVQNRSATAYRFNLALDAIDVDRYLPAAEKSSGGKPAGKAGKAEAVVIPLALLRETDADGQLRIGKLKAFGIHSQDVTLKVSAHHGRITFGPNTAKLYSGSYSGRTVIDASGAKPRFQFDEKLAAMQLGPFLKDAQVFDKFSGAGNVNLALTAQGLDADQIKRTLNGSVSVAIKDGAIEGVDLEKTEAKIKEAESRPGGNVQNILASLPEIAPEKGDKTTFSKLQASATVTNGVVNNKDLAIEAPHLRVTGSGTVNLVTETFDNYLLHVGNFPIIVSGKFDGPKFKPDWNAILRKKLEQKKKEVEKKYIDELRDRFLNKFRR